MIKVVQLVFSIESAGRAGLRLQRAFLETGIDSSIISLQYGAIDIDKIKFLGGWSRLISRLDYFLQSFLTRNAIKKFGPFSYPVLGTNIVKMDQIIEADVIYLHWVLGGFLNLSIIEKLAKLHKPIVFIMHDMWTITGGCHHSFTCEKYKVKCHNCQMFRTNKKNDLSTLLFNKKMKFYTRYNNLYFVSPSKWLYDCAMSSFLTKDKPIFYIPNVIDNRLFKPFDKKVARQILNLDTDQTIISFGAISINSPYKGWSYLLKAIELLSKVRSFEKITVLVFGSGYNQQIEASIPCKTKFLGFLGDEYSIVLAYNASNVFVIPSLADNLPTMVLESLCCGTPVVGFNIGGIPDMIKHKENGYLAKYKNAEDLALGIKFCLENKIQVEILPTFQKDLIVNKHKELLLSLTRLENN